MEKNKGNKIIKDFMGSDFDIEGRIPFYYTINEEFPFSGSKCTEEKVIDEVLVEVEEFGSSLTVYKHSYDNCWGWLMPVIEKIKNIGTTSDTTEEEYNLLNNIDDALIVVRIDLVYEAVLKYIEYFNNKIKK